MSITVLNPGLLSTIQDQGRVGYQQFGVSVSGAMDPRRAALANILAGNPQGAGVIEFTFMPPQLQFNTDCIFVLTGGDFGVTLDGVPLPNDMALFARSGQILKGGMAKTGCRGYFAVSGGFNLPAVMGSQSTLSKAKIGGLDGRPLQKGDVLPLTAPLTAIVHAEKRSHPDPVPSSPLTHLRVVLGPQENYFTAAGLTDFLSETFTVTPQSDRMGYRLEGKAVAHKEGGDIISDGIAFGAIQVPSDGKPIMMMADRQTTGGYTKIATVISADFHLLGQLKPGDLVQFSAVPIQVAQELLLREKKVLSDLDSALNG